MSFNLKLLKQSVLHGNKRIPVGLDWKNKIEVPTCRLCFHTEIRQQRWQDYLVCKVTQRFCNGPRYTVRSSLDKILVACSLNTLGWPPCGVALLRQDNNAGKNALRQSVSSISAWA